MTVSDLVSILKAQGVQPRDLINLIPMGAEAVVFVPAGSAYVLRREACGCLEARELAGTDEAAAVVSRWHDEDKAAEAVQ